MDVEPPDTACCEAVRGIEHIAVVRSVRGYRGLARDTPARWGRGFDLLVTPTTAAPELLPRHRPYAVCLVCTGNICRSPMAAAVLTELSSSRSVTGGGTLADLLTVTSAGTGGWHAGEPMDPRARTALAARGYRDYGHVAHRLAPAELDRLDLVVALDRGHAREVRRLGDVPVVLLRSFDPASGDAADVPDPYYGDDAAFANCLTVVEGACQGLAAHLAGHLGAPPGA